MTVKSAIQLANESSTRLSLLKEHVRHINDNYEIEEAVFGISCGKPADLKTGYLELEKEFDSVEEALKFMTRENQGVYIISPDQAAVGTLRENLSSCESTANVLDISSLEMIGR